MSSYKPKSAAHRQQQAIGRHTSKIFEAMFGARLTQREVGAKMGVSYECARQLEYRTLYKVVMRMKGKI